MRASLKNSDTVNVEQPTRFMGVGFSLNAKQCRKLNKWLADLHREVVARQLRWLDDQLEVGNKAPWRSGRITVRLVGFPPSSFQMRSVRFAK